MRKILLAAAFLCGTGAAWAQDVPPITIGSGFLRECGPKTPNSNPDIRLMEQGAAPVVNTGCTMYVFGIMEGIDSNADLLERQDGKNHRFICVPRWGRRGGHEKPGREIYSKRSKVLCRFQNKPNRVPSAIRRVSLSGTETPSAVAQDICMRADLRGADPTTASRAFGSSTFTFCT